MSTGQDLPPPGRGGAERRRSGPATDAVVAHLERIIFGGQVEPGDSLPSEAELAAALGVSRLTVREGVRSLQARGLVDVAHGRRPAVAHPNAVPLHDFFSASVRRDARGLLELLEVRLAVEVHTAQLAARNATRADIGGLRAALDAMTASAEDEDAFNDADVRLHAAIAAASGNRMLSFLVEGMEASLHSSRMHSIRGYLSRAPDLGPLIALHRDIVDRIADRDADGAAASMRTHLVATRNDLRAAFSLHGPVR